MIVSELVSKLGFQVDDKGAKQFDTRLDGLRDSLNDFQRHINKVGNDTGALMKGVAAGIGFSLANLAYSAAAGVASALMATGKAFVEAGDSYEVANTRLRAATGSAELGKQAYDALYASARQTGVAVTETSRSFLTFYPAMQKAGFGIQATVDLLDGLQKGMLLAGQSTARTGAVLTQLGQAINSNNFGGDELKSFLENAPPAILDAFAKALGKSREELKKLGSQGKLTNKEVIPALREAARAAAEMAGDLPAVIGLAWGKAGVAITNFLGKLNKTLGINRALIKVIDAVGDAFDWLGRRVDDLQRFIDYLGGLRVIIQYIASFLLAYYSRAIIVAFGSAALALVQGFAQGLIFLRTVLLTTAAAAWANLGPLLAVAGAFLLIEDFITWLSGGKSLIGRMFGKPEDVWANAKVWLDKLDEYVNGIVDRIVERFKNMWNEIVAGMPPILRGGAAEAPTAARDGQGFMAPDDPRITQYSGGLMDSLGKLIQNSVINPLAERGLWTTRNDLPTNQLNQMGVRNGAMSTNSTQNNNINNQINITAPGADQASIASASQAGVRRGTEDSLVRLGNSGSLALGLGMSMPRAEAAASP